MSEYEKYSDDKRWLSTVAPLSKAGYDADGENEAFCTLCGARVTVGPNGREFGHFGDCDHRPDELPSGSTSVTNAEREKCPTCGRGFARDRAMRVHHYRTHGERLTRECDECGDEFHHSKKREYCSRECANAARRVDSTNACAWCDSEFHVKPAKADEIKCCSVECRLRHKRRHRVKWSCEECDTTTRLPPHEAESRVFCSPECQHKSRRERAERTCNECGKTEWVKQSEADRPYCSMKCYNRARGVEQAAAD